MIFRSGKRPGLNKRLIIIFLLFWAAYAASPIFVWAAITSSGRRFEKSGPNIFLCELVCGKHIARGKNAGAIVLCNKQQVSKKDEPLVAPALEGGPSAGRRAASEWQSFSRGKANLCLKISIRRELMSIHLTHSPPPA